MMLSIVKMFLVKFSLISKINTDNVLFVFFFVWVFFHIQVQVHTGLKSPWKLNLPESLQGLEKSLSFTIFCWTTLLMET